MKLFITQLLCNNTQILKFLLVGGLTFVIYYVLLWLTFSLATLPYGLAVAVAYGGAIVFHFQTNRQIIFQVESIIIKLQIVRYLEMALLNYMIQLVVIRVCFNALNFNFYLSSFLGVLTTMASGYLLMKHWVFKEYEK